MDNIQPDQLIKRVDKLLKLWQKESGYHFQYAEKNKTSLLYDSANNLMYQCIFISDIIDLMNAIIESNQWDVLSLNGFLKQLEQYDLSMYPSSEQTETLKMIVEKLTQYTITQGIIITDKNSVKQDIDTDIDELRKLCTYIQSKGHTDNKIKDIKLLILNINFYPDCELQSKLDEIRSYLQQYIQENNLEQLIIDFFEEQKPIEERFYLKEDSEIPRDKISTEDFKKIKEKRGIHNFTTKYKEIEDISTEKEIMKITSFLLDARTPNNNEITTLKNNIKEYYENLKNDKEYDYDKKYLANIIIQIKQLSEIENLYHIKEYFTDSL